MLFRNRSDAGRTLASLLSKREANRGDLIILALPRGGVPVAYEIARALDAPLDVYVVRKLGVPHQPELAMGALAEGGEQVVNSEILDALDLESHQFEAVVQTEQTELERRARAYRKGRDLPPLGGRTVILVDDGIATGATMLAALRAVRKQEPARVVVASPVGARSTCRALTAEADDVVCAQMPEPFDGVGRWYADFEQTSDATVLQLLEKAQGFGRSRKDHRAGASARTEAEVIRAEAIPLVARDETYDALLEQIGDARFVLLGEASHGTHEFYEVRAHITQELIARKGFVAVAVEADWPHAERVNRFVRGQGADSLARDALADFQRFPDWMWANTDVVRFVEWLRAFNKQTRTRQSASAGFYGIDLYSLRSSMQSVLEFLDRTNPQAAAEARARYACFDHYGNDPQAYGLSAGPHSSCEQSVVQQLVAMRSLMAAHSRRGGATTHELDPSDDYFFAEQNARLVKNAEHYYRAMYHGRESTWNLRDTHMAETIDALVAHLGKSQETPKVVVWAHNSHVGDARATQMGHEGELNVGQLLRERYGEACFIVGFSTYMGTVTAASRWDAPAERKRVRPALKGSIEALLHETGIQRFLLPLRGNRAVRNALAAQRLERAIGVIYRPESERMSHYFHADVARQFDALIHIDETTAVVPLAPGHTWRGGEPPETYPFAI